MPRAPPAASKPRPSLKAELEALWRERVGPVEGVESLVFTSTFVDFGADVQYELSHEDPTTLLAAVDDLETRLAALPGVVDIVNSLALGKRELLASAPSC
ncbi:MAG: hypothetical protein AAGC60_17445 [Acidobacteriota bacterium]